MYPTDLQYTRDHEWLRDDNGEALVGITDFAQAQLGDVVFVDLPAVGRVLAQGDVFGTIESVKAVSELFSPIAGEVVAINEALAHQPESINKTPHETWMIRLRPAGRTAEGLLDAEAYEALLK